MKLTKLFYKEFLFLNTKYDLEIVDDNQINIEFKFKDLEQFYVEQINIFGNYITEEKLLEISIIDEGDAFNNVLLDKSINLCPDFSSQWTLIQNN